MASTLTNSSSIAESAAFPASPVTVSFGFTATSGRLLVLGITLSNIDAATTPTGWSLAVSGSGGAGNSQLFYKVAAGGETSVDVPHSGVAIMRSCVAEFDSIASSPLDATSTGGATSNTTAESGTTATLSQADEVAVVLYYMSNPRTITAASGFTNVATVASFGMSYKVTSSTSAVTANATWSGAGVDRNCMATFKSASAVALPPTLSVAAGRVSDAAVLRAGRW